jgi:GMP synthase-like glutamine amidotransferase
MRIALIDNGSKLREQLEALLSSHDVTELSYPEAGRALQESFDAIILSGSSLPQIIPVIASPDEVRDEIRLIQETTTPLLGICYGAELIAFSFGGTLTELHEPVRGMRTVAVVSDDPILHGVPKSFEAYESHHWVVTGLPSDFITLARGSESIEMFRHTSRLLYGVQFHPEKMTSEPALKVFENFLTIANNK